MGSVGYLGYPSSDEALWHPVPNDLSGSKPPGPSPHSLLHSACRPTPLGRPRVLCGSLARGEEVLVATSNLTWLALPVSVGGSLAPFVAMWTLKSLARRTHSRPLLTLPQVLPVCRHAALHELLASVQGLRTGEHSAATGLTGSPSIHQRVTMGEGALCRDGRFQTGRRRGGLELLKLQSKWLARQACLGCET